MLTKNYIFRNVTETVGKIRGNIKYSYDKKGDVLYSYINKPRYARNVEVGSGIIIRIDIKTEKIVGFTIVDYKKRIKKGLLKKIPYFEEIGLPKFV